ncbi:MAG TPA: peptide-methionine (S)-S-oxide reductase MsrA [Mucilaginibacter sp.]|nr:peptide-methionine (S)-S-oxide reductase MsrA [Mucilaginibacter sp.]
MKKLTVYFAAILLYCGCANGQTSSNFAELPQPKPGEKVADFGGGCFWSMSEALSELKGVDKVVSGYAGGTTRNPSYEEVCSESTGHAEVVQVYYDPKVISYATLVQGFFSAHNPTELNRQGPDVGASYRTIAFYRTPEEKAVIQNEINKINASKHYDSPVVTQVVPFKVFYPAEKYHQGYYRLHLGENPYLTSVSQPKVEKFRKVMNADLKPEYRDK